MSKKTVIFDFDGTLGDTIGLVTRLYNAHAAQYGYKSVAPTDFPHLRRLGYKKAMKYLGIRWFVLPKLVLTISREMKQHMDEVKPYSGIIPMLNGLQKKGYDIGVLTSNDEQLVRDFFEAHEFPEFSFVVSEKTMFGKEKALKKIMHQHSIVLEDCLYVGDEPRDVTACNKIKMKVVGVTWGGGGKEGFGKAKPRRLVDTVPQLKRAIDALLPIK